MATVTAPTPSGTPAAAVVPAATGSRWFLRAGIAMLVAVYIFGAGASALAGVNLTDLDVFFLPSARIALDGHPLLIYTLRYDASYPTANGPVSIMLLTGVAAFIRQLGWLNDLALRRMIVMAVFAVFPLLMAWEAVAAIDRLRGTPLRSLWRLLAFGLFATAPAVWHAMLLYGHIEQPIAIWLTLLAIRLQAEKRPAWAGLSMGLALLTRSSLVLPCVVLVVVLLGRRRLLAAVTFLGVTGLTVVLGILPFLLADSRDVLYSLVTFRGGLVIGGGSVWYLLLGTPLEDVGMRYDSTVILVAAVLIAAVLVLVRRTLTVAHRDLYGLLALTGLCFPLFIKTTWPYYFLDLYVFIAIWWLGNARGWHSLSRWLGILLPVFFVVCEVLADYGVDVQLDPAALHAESLAITVMETGFLLVFGVYLAARRVREAQPSAASPVASAPALAP